MPTLSDALANIPLAVNASFGTPYYNAVLDELGGFFQDDWRIGDNLVLNLGVRYDYLPADRRQADDVHSCRSREPVRSNGSAENGLWSADRPVEPVRRRKRVRPAYGFRMDHSRHAATP